MKKILAIVLAALMLLAAFAGCTGNANNGGDNPVEAEKGSVYYLNFKPEQDGQWQDLAAAYTEETGIEVIVITAADGTYETTLKSEMAKSEAPTLFQVNGPVGLASWKDYCYDMSASDLYGHLVSDDFALIENNEVLGVSYVIETYGIIANTKLLADAGYKVSDIKDFESLKAVAEDITARSAELGFAAFCSAGMDGSSDWRFKTHLANLPIYYEYEADGIGTTDAIKGTFLDNYKKIWDLYTANSTCDPAILSTKTGEDAVAEFVTGKAVFYQNGTWAYGDVAEVGDENLYMIPIYIDAEGEENQGLCTGTENYWCVNKNAAQADIDATLAFLNWVVTSDAGRDSLANQMNFVTPFDTFTGDYAPSNLFVQQANQYIADGKTSVKWCFPTMPSEDWKNGVGSALTAYSAGTGTWDDVVTAFVNGWATEAAANNA